MNRQSAQRSVAEGPGQETRRETEQPGPGSGAPEGGALEPEHGRMLVDVARESVRHGLENGRALPVDLRQAPAPLAMPGASFVTLHRGDRLRGCIGHLEAIAPLLVSVAENAFNAAFRDPRFPPVGRSELPHLSYEVSVLTPPEPLGELEERSLLEMLRPGIDGLIIELGGRRATFLPEVWRSLRDPRMFLGALKQKAGIPLHAPRYRAWRYGTRCFRDDE